MDTMAETSVGRMRIPPQNLDSEKALLGSIMLRPEAIYEVIDVVTAEDFYSEKHRIVYHVRSHLTMEAKTGSLS